MLLYFHPPCAHKGYTLGSDREVDQASGDVGVISKLAVQTAANRDRIETTWTVSTREEIQVSGCETDQKAWA